MRHLAHRTLLIFVAVAISGLVVSCKSFVSSNQQSVDRTKSASPRKREAADRVKPAPSRKRKTAESVRPALPATAAHIGIPFRVAQGKASADVTITKITYASTAPSGEQSNAGEWAVVNVRIIGKSRAPFHYDPLNFYFQYTQRTNPYRPEDSNMYNFEPGDYNTFPSQLRIGSVTNGKRAHGVVPLEVSNKSLMIIGMTASNDRTLLAQWLITSS